MFTSTKIDEFRASIAAIEQAKEAAMKVARGLAKEALKKMSDIVFQKHPELQSFSWRQYTPYFNDGDECIFRACIDQEAIEINQGNTEDEDGENDSWMIASDRYYDKEQQKFIPRSQPHPLYAAQKACAELLGVIGEEQLKEMFGDHQVITVSRDKGVETETYDHD